MKKEYIAPLVEKYEMAGTVILGGSDPDNAQARELNFYDGEITDDELLILTSWN